MNFRHAIRYGCVSCLTGHVADPGHDIFSGEATGFYSVYERRERQRLTRQRRNNAIQVVLSLLAVALFFVVAFKFTGQGPTRSEQLRQLGCTVLDDGSARCAKLGPDAPANR